MDLNAPLVAALIVCPFIEIASTNTSQKLSKGYKHRKLWTGATTDLRHITGLKIETIRSKSLLPHIKAKDAC